MAKIKLEYEPKNMKVSKDNRDEILQIAEESPVEIEGYQRDHLSGWRYRIQRFGLTIEGDRSMVKDTVVRLIDILGVPDFAASDTDYGLLNEVLKDYGMKTKKWDLEGALDRYPGKYIVPSS